jgi:hypothetical protein
MIGKGFEKLPVLRRQKSNWTKCFFTGSDNSFAGGGK